MLIIESLDQLKDQIFANLADMKIHTAKEFYGGNIPSLQHKPLVCVYLKRLSTNSCATSDLICSKQNGETMQGKKANITLGINIYSKTANCDTIFTDIATRLMLSELHPTNISCISMEYQPAYRAYMLIGELELTRIIATTAVDTYIDGFKLTLTNKNIKEAIR